MLGDIPQPLAVVKGVGVVALGVAELFAVPGEGTAVVFAAGVSGSC